MFIFGWAYRIYQELFEFNLLLIDFVVSIFIIIYVFFNVISLKFWILILKIFFTLFPFLFFNLKPFLIFLKTWSFLRKKSNVFFFLFLIVQLEGFSWFVADRLFFKFLLLKHFIVFFCTLPILFFLSRVKILTVNDIKYFVLLKLLMNLLL